MKERDWKKWKGPINRKKGEGKEYTALSRGWGPRQGAMWYAGAGQKGGRDWLLKTCFV